LLNKTHAVRINANQVTNPHCAIQHVSYGSCSYRNGSNTRYDKMTYF